ncbi:hypothetical protein HK405_000581, partial [Cladochytrium tenue]
MEQLDAVPALEVLNLSCNELECIAGLEHLRRLRVLDVSYNRIARLAGVRGAAGPAYVLEALDLRGNRVADLEELVHLREIQHLGVLVLKEPDCSTQRNKVCEHPRLQSGTRLPPTEGHKPSPAAPPPLQAPLPANDGHAELIKFLVEKLAEATAGGHPEATAVSGATYAGGLVGEDRALDSRLSGLVDRLGAIALAAEARAVQRPAEGRVGKHAAGRRPLRRGRRRSGSTKSESGDTEGGGDVASTDSDSSACVG